MRRDSDDLAIQPGDHDDDDDDTTSSSGNETPSDSDDEDGRPLTQTISQARAPSPFVDEKVSSVLAGDDVPLFHKLRKAESAVGRAWVAAVTIWAKKPEDTQGAWASLNLALSQIRTLWSARNLPRRMTEMIRIIEVLSQFAHHLGLHRRVKDKEYAKALTTSEAKAMVRLKRFYPLTDVFAFDGNLDVSGFTIDIAHRFAIHALQPVNAEPLHMNNLDLRTRDINVDIPAYCALFGMDLSTIQDLDLKGNGFGGIPHWVLDAWDYTNPSGARLNSLDIRSPGQSAPLPVRLLRSSIDLVSFYRGPTCKDSRWTAPSGPPRTWPICPPPTLLQSCVSVLLRHRDYATDKDPYGIFARYTKSSICEVCDSLCFADSASRPLKYEPASHTFSGRTCLVCARKVERQHGRVTNASWLGL